MYLAHHSVVVLVDCVPRGWDPLILSELMRAAHTKHKSGKRNAKDPIPHAARRGGDQHCGHLWVFFYGEKAAELVGCTHRPGGCDKGIIVDPPEHALEEVGVVIPLLVLDLGGLDSERLLIRCTGHRRHQKVLREENHSVSSSLSSPPTGSGHFGPAQPF